MKTNTNRNILLLLSSLLVALISTGCQVPCCGSSGLELFADPIAPDGMPGVSVGFRLGASDTAGTTASGQRRELTAAQEQILRASWLILQSPNSSEAGITQARTDIFQLTGELPPWPAVVIGQVEEQPLEQAPAKQGFWAAAWESTKAAAAASGRFVMASTFDYSNLKEGGKSTAVRYAIAGLMHERGWIDIGPLAFWDGGSDQGKTDNEALADSLVARTQQNKNVAKLSGKNNTLLLKDVQQREFTLELSGEGNTIEADFQQDSSTQTFGEF